MADGKWARDWVASALVAGTIEHPKQAWSTLEKWARKRLYDYGTSLDLGWIKQGAMFPRIR